jgi:hypothetical protein
MNFTAVDLKYLRAALVAFAVAISLGAGSVWAINHFRTLANKEHQIALRKSTEAQAKLARVSQEQQELTEKTLRFQELVKRGYTEPEDRLDWVELLDRAQKVRKISDFQYEFAAQRPADEGLIPLGASGGGYDFNASQQRLKVKVLHEGDVWNVVDDIKRSAKAFVLVRNCTFERLPPAAIDRGTGPYIGAECVLEWITLKERT